MKARHLLPLLASLAFTHTSRAADITWDTTTGDNAVVGGTGDWNTITSNWTTDDGDTNIAWDNTTNAGDIALFSTGTGRVNITEDINLAGITTTTTNNSTIGGRGAMTYVLQGDGNLNFGTQQGSIDTLASGLLNLQINNSLIGTGGLSVNAADAPASGNGWIYLVGDNSGLSGGITVQNGMIGVWDQSNLGTNAIALQGNAGILAPNNYAGPAASQINGPASLTLSNNIAVSGSENVLRVWGGRTMTLTGAITGSGGLIKADGGTLVLSNNNDGFSGNLLIGAGTVSSGVNTAATGTGALTVTGATLNTFAAGGGFTATYSNNQVSVENSTWNFAGTSPGNVTHTYNFSGGDVGNNTATDPATAIQITDSTLNFSSTNTTTKAFNGRINWSGDNTINRTSSAFTHTTNFNRAWYGDGTITINKTGGATGRSMNFNGAGSAFDGTLVLNNTQASDGDDPVFHLNQSMGATTFEVRNRWNLNNNAAGALDEAVAITITHTASRLTLTEAVNNSSLGLTVNNGGVNVGAGTSTIGNLSGAGGFIDGTDVTSALVINQTSDATYEGAITGNLAITQAGAATLTLAGNNSYTGATTVSAGTLLVTGQLGNSDVSVAAGAAFGGSGTVAGTINFASGAFLEVSDINTPLTVGSTVTFGAGFGIANLLGVDWDALDLHTPYTLISSSQTFTASDISNFGPANAAAVGTGRQAYFKDGSLQVVVIPEPGAALLGGLGVLLLLRRRR